jgi:phospholipase C
VLLALIPAASRSLAAPESPVASSTASSSPASTTVISPASPIKHVVIIYQENHTFDDVLGAVCESPDRVTPCNGYTGPVTFEDGITAENVVQPDLVPNVAHGPRGQRHGIDNEWDHIAGCTEAPYMCVSHVDPAAIPNLALWADTYTISDTTFAAGDASSFGAHVTLGAGTIDEFHGTNPVNSRTGAEPHYGWGCPSNKDALWGEGSRSELTFEPTCIPNRQGKGAYRATRVPHVPSIMERMEQAGHTWHIYEGDSETEPTMGIWSICSYFSWCWRNRWDLEHESSRADFVDAAEGGKLPDLSILIPTTGGISQHNFSSMSKGDNYLGDMVGAVMDGPDWNSTAIFITYDDCGCFYDHVVPPKDLGLRNPMVIISPWAKPQGVDSTRAVQPYSMLSFTQHLFDLRPLTDNVTDAYDYANAFDFSQQPLSGVPVQHTRVARSVLREAKRLEPLVENDPT